MKSSKAYSKIGELPGNVKPLFPLEISPATGTSLLDAENPPDLVLNARAGTRFRD
jgi:hypothetical protein